MAVDGTYDGGGLGRVGVEYGFGRPKVGRAGGLPGREIRGGLSIRDGGAEYDTEAGWGVDDAARCTKVWVALGRTVCGSGRGMERGTGLRVPESGVGKVALGAAGFGRGLGAVLGPKESRRGGQSVCGCASTGEDAGI